MDSNKQDNLGLQMVFQNLVMYLFGELTQPMLMYKQQIHFYTILLIFQTMLIFHVAISRLEMEMNILILPLNLHTDPARVFREVMGYVYANNDFQGGTLLNRSNFENLFPFVYFDLTKQKIDLKDGVTKLSFHYELNANPDNDYNIYALVLHEREAEIEQKEWKTTS